MHVLSFRWFECSERQKCSNVRFIFNFSLPMNWWRYRTFSLISFNGNLWILDGSFWATCTSTSGRSNDTPKKDFLFSICPGKNPLFRSTIWNVPLTRSWLNVPMFQCSNVPMFQCSNVPMFKCSNVQMFKCSNVQMFKCLNVQMFKC